MIKSYSLLEYLSFSTSFMVNDKQVFVSFEGGTKNGRIIRGYFTTGDEELQKAIEKDTSYGKIFKLDEDRTKIANEDFVPDSDSDKDDDKDDGFTTIVNITSIKEAREYILQNYQEITPEDISNVGKLKEVMDIKKIKFDVYRPR